MAGTLAQPVAPPVEPYERRQDDVGRAFGRIGGGLMQPEGTNAQILPVGPLQEADRARSVGDMGQGDGRARMERCFDP